MEDLSFLDPESKKLSVEFILKYIEMQKKLKYLKKDIKYMRQQFNEMGLPTRVVLKAYKEMTAEKKEDKNDRMNIETFKDLLINDNDIQVAYRELEEDE